MINGKVRLLTVERGQVGPMQWPGVKE